MKKIKPCPFCGADCEIEFENDYESYRVRCKGDNQHKLDWWGDTKEEAIDVWNERVEEK